MKQRAGHPPSGRTGRGFTLIEVMAVLLLLALIAGVALPAFGRGGTAEAENDANEIGAAIEYARRTALVTRAPQRLVVDLRQAHWWLEHQPRSFAQAPEGEPGELPLWADDEELPLAPPAEALGGYRKVGGLIGAGVLRETVRFAGVETGEGWIEDGTVTIELRPDGSADRVKLVLEADNGEQVWVGVEPFDQHVRIQREAF